MTLQSAPPTFTETKITYNGSAYSPAIYGDRIVWEDYRSGNWSRDIYVHNLSISNETQITASRSAGSSSIYGNILVWQDDRNGSSNIYLHDLSTSQETQITTNGSAINPVIYGDIVAWMDDHLGVNYDIYAYNLSTSQETQITTNGSAYSPAIYGDRIVWYSDFNGNSDIYMYNLSTSQEIQITTSGSAARPAIYEDKIVWQDDRNGSSDIYMYNLSNSEETRITDSGSAYSPAIYGNRIVWEDYRKGSYINESGDIYMYDLFTSNEIQITNTGSAGCPTIFNNKIVWQDCRNNNTWDNSDIYMCTISEEEPKVPVANFSSNVTIGYAPLSVQFNDSSENASRWYWDFGDRVNSTEQNPMHTYPVAGNYTVNLTVSNENGTSSRAAIINVYQAIPLQSIRDIRSSSGSIWINWTWTNPEDSRFNHTEVFLNGNFQTNTSAEYFNATDLQPEISYTLGTRTVDIDGNINETWVNDTAITSKEVVPDVEKPVIESIILFPASTTAGSKIDISANITDNVGVAEVTAGNVQLMNIDGSWRGNITAPSSLGKYFLSIKANDAAGNTVDTSVPYSIVRRKGGVSVEVLPAASKIVAGKNTTLAIKVKNTQNVDDTFKVRINVNGLPAFYRAGDSWFNWTGKTVNLRAKQEVLIPIELKVPAGTVNGVKVFRASVNSEKFSVHGSDNGYLVISRPSKNINKQIGPRGLWFSR